MRGVLPSNWVLEDANHLTLILTFSLKGEGTCAQIPDKSNIKRPCKAPAPTFDPVPNSVII